MQEFKAHNGTLIIDNEKITVKPSKVFGLGKRVMEIYFEDIKKIQFEKPKLMTNGYMRFELVRKSGTKKTKFEVTQEENAIFFTKKQMKDIEEAKRLIESHM
ncbi:hypothetical protein BHU24_17820 [Bacillus pseudomycoides]|uniref:hypothetical protein n=1 Tax=Bacillus pseudomycoides TaxID=64104 RepID=UPI000BF283C7|nr:hypothetical protein [Bacillus pseudomycoides]MBD5797060.1 hypothetical protein [Bacillus pseudomycoides]PEO86141.1 hypothetical protein CN571_20015 [Bacillus pseudomycoides]